MTDIKQKTKEEILDEFFEERNFLANKPLTDLILAAMQAYADQQAKPVEGQADAAAEKEYPVREQTHTGDAVYNLLQGSKQAAFIAGWKAGQTVRSDQCPEINHDPVVVNEIEETTDAMRVQQAKERVYWQKRCLAAEAVILYEQPKYSDQLNQWQELKNKEVK